MTTLAVILARGGSKGIPGKNRRLFRGTPLAEWCLRAAMNATHIDHVLLSSDDDKILEIGTSLNCPVHKRKPEDATDTVSSEQSLMAAISEHELGRDAQIVLMVQPTSPFTSSKDFDQALEKFVDGNYDSLLTVVNDHSFTWRIQDDGTATPSYDPKDRPMRQSNLNQRKENGAFYITKRSILESDNCRLGGRMGCYTMPDYAAVDIDEEFDWLMAETLAEKLGLEPEDIS
ncbi:MAG: acylneuraminate cytidylyltransferase [Euryarchaeota archaeon]|nr:acylneuraminate cytidylyltransferase [Euryarchaeota archaeon]MEC7704226.1 acylneuraminate cytidylyltransferase family protein [Candidatus Thermoplasmatota archaeon]MED5486218.1 acylneuraminate cytidylyltransferase family protein [Candidatus Thermoplasmatota archaeon]